MPTQIELAVYEAGLRLSQAAILLQETGVAYYDSYVEDMVLRLDNAVGELFTAAVTVPSRSQRQIEGLLDGCAAFAREDQATRCLGQLEILQERLRGIAQQNGRPCLAWFHLGCEIVRGEVMRPGPDNSIFPPRPASGGFAGRPAVWVWDNEQTLSQLLSELDTSLDELLQEPANDKLPAWINRLTLYSPRWHLVEAGLNALKRTAAETSCGTSFVVDLETWRVTIDGVFNSPPNVWPINWADSLQKMRTAVDLMPDSFPRPNINGKLVLLAMLVRQLPGALLDLDVAAACSCKNECRQGRLKGQSFRHFVFEIFRRNLPAEQSILLFALDSLPQVAFPSIHIDPGLGLAAATIFLCAVTPDVLP